MYTSNLTFLGYKIPNYFWFVVSGSLCDAIQFFIDYGISTIYTYEWERSTICWTLSYTASVGIRHYSHKQLVFGDYDGTYCTSLSRTYLTYSSSIILSLITNHIITTYLQLSHLHAWIITMLWTGIYNYFMLKASWKSKPASDRSILPVANKNNTGSD